MKEFRFVSQSVDKTKELAKVLAGFLDVGDVITLEGDLGAGKTTFVGGVASSFGITEAVISPTFNILKCYYGGKLPLYHIDAYRLEGQRIELGLEEFIEGDGVCFIEWPKFIEPLMTDERLEVKVHNIDEHTREFVFIPLGLRFEEMVRRLEEEVRE